jgi:hypothetical protein
VSEIEVHIFAAFEKASDEGAAETNFNAESLI